ncbi:MAG: GTPase Era [Gemmatimonadaceae bacterium]
MTTRAGLVAVVGKPNAGKSTLLNRIVGEKLSIVSPKPQSTRDRIVGIHSQNGVQIVLVDTPGLLAPEYALQRAMRATALSALADADVVLYVADATRGPPPPLADAAAIDHPPGSPIVVALNKADLLTDPEAQALRNAQPSSVLVSATTGAGMQNLVARLGTMLPASPFLYPEEDLSVQSTRFFAAEMVRETALEQLTDEVPYSVACAIEEFREGRPPVYIRAVVYVERESQKHILIGEKGSRIREIGRHAREKIERLVDSPVYLDLWVKVLPNWRRDVRALRRLGYTTSHDPNL